MPWHEMVNFTPLQGLAGGALLGLGAAILLLFNGRVAGFSGIISNMGSHNHLWRLAFLAGTLISGTALHRFLNLSIPDSPLPASGLIVAGLLVGFGTSLGNGCTSGHGICGLSRLSLRSLIGVLVFMASAMVTVYVMRHL